MEFDYGTYGHVASVDRRRAEGSLYGDPGILMFYSQQMLEKILKHYISNVQGKRNSDLLKSHNLRTLARVCGVPEIREDELRLLKDAYYETRYPGEDYWEPDVKTAQRAAMAAFEVYDMVLQNIEKAEAESDPSIKKMDLMNL